MGDELLLSRPIMAPVSNPFIFLLKSFRPSEMELLISWGRSSHKGAGVRPKG